MIPKIIHQTWKDTEVPEHWASSPPAWKKHHPGWSYILWTDEMNRQLIAENYPWFLETYDSFPHAIQRADAVRYFILYTYGGLYADLDLEPLRSLEPLLEQCQAEVYLVGAAHLGGLTNSIMASQKGAGFWRSVFSRLMGYQKLPWYQKVGKHLGVMFSTGPAMITEVARAHEQTICLLPQSVLLPCTVCEPYPCEKGGYLRALEGCSWIRWDTRCYNFVLCHWKDLLIIILLLVVLGGYLWYRYYRRCEACFTRCPNIS